MSQRDLSPKGIADAADAAQAAVDTAELVVDALVAETAAVGGKVILKEATNNGVNTATFQCAASLTGNRTISVPNEDVVLANIAVNTIHTTGDGSDHADVATNSVHVAGDGSDHADVATNTATLAEIEPGAVATAVLIFGDAVNAENTVTIGADVYEFVAPAGVVALDTNIAVATTGVAATELDNLIAAINADDVDNEHPTIFLQDGITPALANGTESVVADEVATGIRVRSATVVGGQAVGANPNIVLAEALTPPASIWDVGNVNLNTLGGKAASAQPCAAQSKAVTAPMIASGARFSFPFVVTRFMVQVLSATGFIRTPAGAEALSADTFEIDEGDVLYTSGGAATPNAIAGDVITVIAWP